MLWCSDTGRAWVGRRVQGAQEVCLRGTAFSPGSARRGLASSVEGRVVGEVGVSRRFWYQCIGTRVRELEDRTSC